MQLHPFLVLYRQPRGAIAMDFNLNVVAPSFLWLADFTRFFQDSILW